MEHAIDTKTPIINTQRAPLAQEVPGAESTQELRSDQGASVDVVAPLSRVNKIIVSPHNSSSSGDQPSRVVVAEVSSLEADEPLRPTASNVQFFIVCAVLLVDSISTTMLFSYVGLLVVHIHPTLNRSSAGYVSGILVGLFQGAQIFTLPFWGGMSDTVGRKPILMVSLALSAFVALSFGLVDRLWIAFIIRFLHGSIVAGAVTVKSYITEITDETNSARAFSMMSLARSFGSFMGPAVGGFLYDPVNNNRYFAFLVGEPLEGEPLAVEDRPFMNQLIRDYPALVPGMVLATYALSVLFLVNRYMVETNAHAIPLHTYASEQLGAFAAWVGKGFAWARQRVFCCRRNAEQPTQGRRFRRVATEDGHEEEDDDEEQRAVDNVEALPAKEQIGTEKSKEAVTVTVGVTSPTTSTSSTVASPVEGDAHLVSLKVLLDANAALNAKPKLGYWDVWTHPVLKYVIPMYMALTSYNIGTVEVIPLFAIAYRRDGGLELTSPQVGGLLMTGAFAAILANTFFSTVAKRVPLMRLWMCCNLVGAIATLMLATASVAAGNYLLVFVLVAVINLARTTTTTWCFSMYNMFVSNVAPKKHLGRVTAMCQASGAMARCVSPMATSAIFAWSISSQDHVFPFNHYFVFCCTAGLALLCMVLSRRIDSDLVTKRHR